MLKKNGGITLIALVVTIIVLLILAGITIAMLTGDNGIITRTNAAKMSQIEGQVDEEIKLAIQTAKIYAMQKSVETPGGGWVAADHLATVITEIRKTDLKEADGYTTVEGKVVSGSEKTYPGSYIKVRYTTSDYQEATNDASAEIIAIIKVENNNFEIKAMKVKRTATEVRYPVGESIYSNLLTEVGAGTEAAV